MSTVIKSGTGAHNINRVAFNLEDISEQADKYLDQVRVKAAEIVVEAQKQAEAVRRQAEAEGKQAAMRAVERVLDEKVGKKLESLLPALNKVVSELNDSRQTWLAHWEKAVVHLACSIAQRVCRLQLKIHPEISMALTREALEMAAGSPQIQVRLNPTDFESLGTQSDRLARTFAAAAEVKFIADAAIELGGCRVETQHGAIDQQFTAQLNRIEEELTGANQD
jgi:flagellar assembly protein FliH